MTKNTRFSPEVRQRAVRMVLESQSEYDSQWATICSIAPKIGCTPETLRVWVRQHERDTGGGDGGLTTAERQRLKELERENRELRHSNDILRQALILRRRSSTTPGNCCQFIFARQHATCWQFAAQDALGKMLSNRFGETSLHNFHCIS